MSSLRHWGERGSVALTVRTQYVHRTLRLFSYSSDFCLAAHWSICSERIAPRSVAHLVRSVLQLHALSFFCNTFNYRYSSITVFLFVSARATATRRLHCVRYRHGSVPGETRTGFSTFPPERDVSCKSQISIVYSIVYRYSIANLVHE
jgi:hypothetical protein